MASSVPPIEIGSLTAVSPNESKFIGSSSGIFFVNTVRRAFATSKVRTPGEDSQPGNGTDAEIFIGGVDVDDNTQDNESGPQIPNNSIIHFKSKTPDVDKHLLGQPPSREHASKLIQVYFRVWHPLFPFLHGPTLVKEVEDYYNESQTNHLGHDKAESRRSHCRYIIFQCVFNIAALDKPDLHLDSNCSIDSVTVLTTELCSLATRHDIPVLQALMAGQIYLIATMSLHAASTIGGVLLRLLLHGGLHRCPYRYPQISSHDADIRKRIFWSAYAADRHLSQALGLPLGIQDTDIDVCVPGLTEIHRPVRAPSSINEIAGRGLSQHLPDGDLEMTDTRPQPSAAPNGESPHPVSPSTMLQPPYQIASREKRPGEDALAHYVVYGRLTGRALEILHKSLNVRVIQYNSVLELTSDIHLFWNSLPGHLQDLPNRSQNENSNESVLGLYFTIIYQQLILLVNRPFLSLKPSTLEFRLSLQTCITASRTVISTLSSQTSGCQCISWPGTLSVAWMSGLILAFACALNLYPVEKGFPEIQSCLKLLNEMSGSSKTAKHCHSALKSLLDDLSSPHYGESLDHFTTSLSVNRKRTYSPSRDSSQNNADSTNPKRQKPGTFREESVHNTWPPDDDNPPAEDSTNSNSQKHSSNPSHHIAMAPTSHGNDINFPGINNTTQLLLPTQQTGMNSGGDEHPATAYTHDIFGDLSFENLLQYDESFGVDFWNDNYFSGS